MSFVSFLPIVSNSYLFCLGLVVLLLPMETASTNDESSVEPPRKKPRLVAPPVPTFAVPAPVKSPVGKSASPSSPSAGSRDTTTPTMESNKLLDWDKQTMQRWCSAPRMGQSVPGTLFIPLKVPLSTVYEDQFDEGDIFTVSMFLDRQIQLRRDVGLALDATGINAYYHDPREWDDFDVEMTKLPVDPGCLERPFDTIPSENVISNFVKIVDRFWTKQSKRSIAVFCADGIHRSGFLICCFMVMKGFSLQTAIDNFARAVPPGLYRKKFIYSLCQRFSTRIPKLPAPPSWDTHTNDATILAEEQEMEAKLLSQNPSATNERESQPAISEPIYLEEGAVPCESLPFGDRLTVTSNRDELLDVQRICFRLAHSPLGISASAAPSTTSTRHPMYPASRAYWLSQPNMEHLSMSNYYVSWIPNGVRALLLIRQPNAVYLIDKLMQVKRLSTMRFPLRTQPQRHMENTLLDGIFVLDQDPSGVKIWRYLVFDVIVFMNRPVKQEPLKNRLHVIQSEIIGPRKADEASNPQHYSKEPFRIRLKDNFKANKTEYMLSSFLSKLTHSHKGLIYLPVDEPYSSTSPDTNPSQSPDQAVSKPSVFKWSKDHLDVCIPEAELIQFIKTNCPE